MQKLLTLLLLAAGVQAHAGYLRGIVTDSTGDPLPFATVFLRGTTTGATTNASGEYFFEAPAGSHTAAARYVGYLEGTKAVTIGASDTVVVNFRLREERTSRAIGEVVVRAGEDPALRIIRKAIARRRAHLEEVESFQTRVYIKGTLKLRDMPTKIPGLVSKKDMREGREEMGLDSGGKGVIYLVEQISDYYSQRPGKRRTVVRRVRESGDPSGLGLSSVPPVITMYEENVQLLGGTARGFVSPIADGAPGFYRYKLLGETVEDGRIIYALSVEPKRAYEPLFRGRIYLVDGDWGFHSLDLTATKTSGLQGMDTVRLVQTFLPNPGAQGWVIKSQVLYPAVALFGFDIVGSLATVYDNQKVNAPIPDSIFGGRVVSSYDRDARNSDSGYWSGVRPIPLETEEARDFVVKDSIRLRRESPGFRDSARRRGNRFDAIGLVTGGYDYTGEDNRWSAGINALISAVNFNTVEGLNITLRPSVRWRLDSFQTLEARAGLRYGIANSRPQGIAALEWRRRERAWAGRGSVWTLTGGRFVFQIDPQNPVPPILNAYATLVEGYNPMKLYERWEGSLRYAWSGGNGLRLGAGVSWQRRQPLENSTTYSWQNSDEVGFTPNTPRTYAAPVWEPHDALLARVSAQFQPGVTYILQPDRKVPRGSRWPVFNAAVSAGIPAFGARTDYVRWRLGVSDAARLKLLGTLSYNVAVGGFARDRYVSLPDLTHFRGNEFSIAAPYLQSFQGMPYYRYSNREPVYGEAHVEYNLQGLLSNKIPLLRQARWTLLTGGNGFYAGDDLRYGEVFVGVDNLGYKLFRFLRVDAVRAWGSLQQPVWLVRAGFNLGGAFRVVTGVAEGDEW